MLASVLVQQVGTECSLSGSDFPSQVGREMIFKAGREATEQQVCKEWALWKQERER